MKEYIIKFDETRKNIDGGYSLTQVPIELVRCKDCGFGEERKDNTGDSVVICHNPDNGTFEYTHKPEWYCGDGISKEG